MSTTMIRVGNSDMLRSMYDFKATYAKTLSFKVNDYFILHQTTTKHKNWWEVINERGEMGFIPSNYVETITVSSSFYIQYLENVMENVRHNDISPEFLFSDKKELLLRLKEMKRNIECTNAESTENLPPLMFKNSEGKLESIVKSNSSSSSISKSDDKKDVVENPIKPIHQVNHSKDNIKKSIDNIQEECKKKNVRLKSDVSVHEQVSNHSSDPVINSQTVFELVESVRINTNLSHEMSRIAVATVIQDLHVLLPASVFPYLSTILSHTQYNNLSVDDLQIEQTHDASRLKIIFNQLTYCKEDSQQRNWMLPEDEDVIKDYLRELISILSNAHVSISKHVISADHYHVITTLIQYYQMEIRWSIRQLLLQSFGCMCGLDKTIINIMLNSVLPGELARDMMANPTNIVKLNYSSLLLTMMFSMGDQMPVTHLEYLGVHFIRFILNYIENPPNGVEEELPDLFLNFIVSFNLQFIVTEPQENVVLKAISEGDLAKNFTEKILLLFNREEDPARIFDHEPAPPHSVVKLFIDLFSNKKTADIFYTNDIKVLIDITVRNILDLSPGEKRRTLYIELCRRIVRNTKYQDHMHQRDEILKCFTRIFCEESSQSLNDQKLVKEIINEFPQYFK